MENKLQQLIASANALYSKNYLDEEDYALAYEKLKSALEQLFKVKGTQTGAAQAQTLSQIAELLEKAELCQGKMQSEEQKVKKKPNAKKPPVKIEKEEDKKEDKKEEKKKLKHETKKKPEIPKRASVPIPLAQKNKPAPSRNSKTQENNPYEQQIEQEIVEKTPTVTWDSISGLAQAKEILQEAIIKPILYPHIYTGLRSPPKGILLFGPPGTGKTLLAKAVASQCGATFLNMSSATLTSKNYGDAEKLVRAMFSVARKNQPSVIFIDEVDSILGARKDSQHEASRRLETEFLVQMDGVGCNSEDRVLLIAATNRPQELDEAVRRRLTKRVYIPLPEAETRYSLIKTLLKENGEMTEQDYQIVVRFTDGFSGSDLAALCKEAALGSVRGLSEKQLNSGKKFYITKQHFENALRVIRPSVPRGSLDFYEKWNDEFGVR